MHINCNQDTGKPTIAAIVALGTMEIFAGKAGRTRIAEIDGIGVMKIIKRMTEMRMMVMITRSNITVTGSSNNSDSETTRAMNRSRKGIAQNDGT